MFQKIMAPIAAALFLGMIGLIIAVVEDQNLVWLSGMVLVLLTLVAARLGRMATVHLCIIEEAEKILTKERNRK